MNGALDKKTEEVAIENIQKRHAQEAGGRRKEGKENDGRIRE